MTSILDAINALALTIRNGLPTTDPMSGRVFALAPDALNPPTAVVVPAGDFIDYAVTFDGQDNFALTVKVFCGAQETRTGQIKLLEYFAPSGALSLPRIIEADDSWGGVVTMVNVERAGSYGSLEWGEQVFFGAQLHVTCGTP